MPAIKISALPVLPSANISANGSNTIFVVVDLSTGTATTKQLSLANLDVFIDNVGSIAFAHANGAFSKANSANVLAQNAYNFANTISGGAAIDNVARASANSATILAQAAFNQANTAIAAGSGDALAFAIALG